VLSTFLEMTQEVIKKVEKLFLFLVCSNV